MTRPARLRTPQSEIQELKDRVYDLERRLRASQTDTRPDSSGSKAPTLRFNKNGTLDVSSSDHDPMGYAGQLIKLKARLTTAGTSTTTAKLLHQGSTVVATFTFAAGQLTPSSTPTVAFTYAEDDYFTLSVTAAGTGAGGLVVAGWSSSVLTTVGVTAEGGNASGTGSSSYDGGASGTTYTSTLDGGSA